MNKPPAFQFYASDFLADTASWTAEEAGVYIRLLASEWINGSIPPRSDKRPNRLALMCGVSEKCLRRVWGQVGKKFVAGNDGNLRNLRLESEREKQTAYREEKSKAGMVGAQKRWNAASAGKQTDGTAMVLPLAEGMAKNSSSSSSSFSSSKKEKDQRVSHASEEPTPPTKQEWNAIAERCWQELRQQPGGAEILDSF